MKRKWFRFLLCLGLIPLIAPFVSGIYHMWIEKGWTLMDWLILYSYIYWPTYLVGIVLMIISVIGLKKKG